METGRVSRSGQCVVVGAGVSNRISRHRAAMDKPADGAHRHALRRAARNTPSMSKWVVLSLLFFAVAAAPRSRPARPARPPVITIKLSDVGKVCAGWCDGIETQVAPNGAVRVRIFDFVDGHVRQERHFQVDVAKAAAFARIMETIRPAGVRRGHFCDAQTWRMALNVDWGAAPSASRISGCFSRAAPDDNHIFCVRARAMIALGFDSNGMAPARGFDPAALNGCSLRDGGPQVSRM
ncbi:MAG TPA: hypothetical protein VK980_08470 [Sphingomonas sp.]|nr:hypothetical protein [Sphingomonas sp.]